MSENLTDRQDAENPPPPPHLPPHPRTSSQAPEGEPITSPRIHPPPRDPHLLGCLFGSGMLSLGERGTAGQRSGNVRRARVRSAAHQGLSPEKLKADALTEPFR